MSSSPPLRCLLSPHSLVSVSTQLPEAVRLQRMNVVYDPSTLFNLATLHLHVPPAPPQHGAPSSTSLLTPGLSAEEVGLQEQETDAWVSAIARAEEREQAYYGELHRPRRLSCRADGPSRTALQTRLCRSTS